MDCLSNPTTILKRVLNLLMRVQEVMFNIVELEFFPGCALILRTFGLMVEMFRGTKTGILKTTVTNAWLLICFIVAVKGIGMPLGFYPEGLFGLFPKMPSSTTTGVYSSVITSVELAEAVALLEVAFVEFAAAAAAAVAAELASTITLNE